MEIYALTQNVIFPPPWFMGVGDYIKFDTTALHSNMKKVTTDLFRFVRDLVKVKVAETPPKVVKLHLKNEKRKEKKVSPQFFHIATKTNHAKFCFSALETMAQSFEAKTFCLSLESARDNYTSLPIHTAAYNTGVKRFSTPFVFSVEVRAGFHLFPWKLPPTSMEKYLLAWKLPPTSMEVDLSAWKIPPTSMEEVDLPAWKLSSPSRILL